VMARINWPTPQPTCCTDKVTAIGAAGLLSAGWRKSVQPINNITGTTASFLILVTSPARR
jgi:hypothetical protein